MLPTPEAHQSRTICFSVFSSILQRLAENGLSAIEKDGSWLIEAIYSQN